MTHVRALQTTRTSVHVHSARPTVQWTCTCTCTDKLVTKLTLVTSDQPRTTDHLTRHGLSHIHTCIQSCTCTFVRRKPLTIRTPATKNRFLCTQGVVVSHRVYCISVYVSITHSICGQNCVSSFVDSSAQHREDEAEPDFNEK